MCSKYLCVCCGQGEGIHHAMDAGKTAAGFIRECLDQGNFDAEVMSIWHDIWMDRFGSDFKWSVHDNHDIGHSCVMMMEVGLERYHPISNNIDL